MSIRLLARAPLIAVAAVAASVCFAQGDLGATPQLHPNPGFEQGDGASASAWGVWPPAGRDAGVSSVRDPDVHHRGAFSGRLRIEPDGYQGICTWHHPAVTVHQGQELVLSMWVKAEGVEGSCGADVQLRRNVSEIVGSAACEAITGTFDWRRVLHRFTVPEGVTHVCVVPLLRGKGTAWFDDVQLYGTPSLKPLQVEAPPKLDGKLDDGCWQDGNAVAGFALADGSGLPERPTRVWAACDRANLYFAFRCATRPGDVLKADVTQRDGTVWTDDDVEVFINPTGDFGEYFQFVVNPLGTRYDSCRTDPSWNSNWRTATSREDDAWTVEMAIPAGDLPLDLTVGQDWCANFGRADKTANQASSWSCVFGSFHSPARFGRLTGLGLDLTPYYERDARGRIGEVRRAFEAATADLNTGGAPESIAAPFSDRAVRIAEMLARLEVMVRDPQSAPAEAWSQVRPQAAQVAKDVVDLQQSSLRLRSFVAWRQGDAVPQFGLATAPAMVKVRRDGRDFAGQVTKQLTLSAARNESEGGQVIAVSLSEADIPDCRATVTALSGPDGAVIPEASLSLRLVGYVKTAKPGYETAYVGDWPDPLLPNAPFTLQAGEVQPIWLRVSVPTDAPAGDYAGNVTISGGGESRALEVKLHVFDFALPRRQHLATPFGCDPGSLSQWYAGTRDYQATMAPEVWTRWNEFLLDYRLTPTQVGRAYAMETRGPDGKPAPDYSIADHCMEAVADRIPLQGVAVTGLGGSTWSAERGSSCRPITDDAHSGQRCARFSWPKTEGWASLSRSLAGAEVAARQCKAFRFWVKSLDASFAEERIVTFVNAFPNRWVTTFPVGGAEWHEVRIPVAQYHHNTSGEALTVESLKTCGDFQFVIDKKQREIQFLVDDLVAECEGGDMLIEGFEEEEGLALLRERLAPLGHWREKGWSELAHVYARDELRPEEYDQIIPMYRQALSLAPDAPLMQTYYTNRRPQELVGIAKIWCATTSVYDEEFLGARRAAGDTTWLYVCCGPQPPFANFFIDQPATDHRILFWQAWQRNCTGFLYWETNYWHGMMPMRADEPRWPEVPWEQERVNTYREYKVNGDGFLIYPGPDWTPWPSVRLESIRDGIEDYEYLCLLRECSPRSPLLAVGDDISKDFTHYTTDPAKIEARRAEIARAIEAARGGSVAIQE